MPTCGSAAAGASGLARHRHRCCAPPTAGSTPARRPPGPTFTDMAFAARRADRRAADGDAPRPPGAHRRRDRRGGRRVDAARRRGADDAGRRADVACPTAAVDVATAPTSWCSARRGLRRSAGLVLAGSAPSVVRVSDPRRLDPFPLRDAPGTGPASRRARPRRGPRPRPRCAALLADADLLVDGTTPRVLAQRRARRRGLADAFPALSVLRVAAFADERPSGVRPRGRGAAVAGPPATTRPGSVARRSPTRSRACSARSSAVELLTARAAGRRARASRSKTRSATCSQRERVRW